MCEGTDLLFAGSVYTNDENEQCGESNNCDSPPSSEISLREFFDFLSSAFKTSLGFDEKSYFRELVSNEFVTKLLGISVDKFKANLEPDGKVSSKVYSVEQDRFPVPYLNSSSKEDEEHMQGIRSLFIRFNRKPDDPEFAFSHLPILEAENILKNKLDVVIDEGVLDSMFPFLISKFSASVNSKTLDENPVSNEGFTNSAKPPNKQRSRKARNPEAEIEIQVCDEVNNISKNFKCSEALLLSKMEYFARVTEGQRLEDMDISVHCDVAIFEWLMKWVHRPTKQLSPPLNVSSVTPILISAMFLRMESLVDECVNFFKINMKAIVAANNSLSCLSDSILEKIADTMSNVELDSLEDPTDKIQSKLFTKFIISLSKRNIDKGKGHYSSLAFLFRCTYCKQILNEDIGQSIPCIPVYLAVDSNGYIQGSHKEDTSWNLNSYIKQLKRELSTWKNVYWKLWGTCHYLKCSKCRLEYPMTGSLCCRYHPNGAHFGVRISSSNHLIPVGQYVCCGARIYKFDVLSLPNGCMYKSHVPVETESSIKLIAILENKRAVICFSPTERMLVDERNKSDNPGREIYNNPGLNLSWWPLSQGVHLEKVYSFNDLLNSLDEQDRESDQDLEYEANGNLRIALEEFENGSSDSDFNDIASIGDGEDSEASSSSNKCYTKPISLVNPKLWTAHRSIRFNQDNQREREEKIIKNIINKLNRNKNDNEFDLFLASNDVNSLSFSEGGTYSLLEEEWREDMCRSEPSTSGLTIPSKPTKSRSGKFTYF